VSPTRGRKKSRVTAYAGVATGGGVVPITVANRGSFNGLAVEPAYAAGSGEAHDATIGGSEGLTVTPGDHEIELSWSSVPTATTYRVEVTDPAADGDTSTLTTTASLSYTHSPDYYAHENADASWSGKGLIPGIEYAYTVTPLAGATPLTALTSSGRPYYVADYPPAFTTVNGSTVRDARNTGHWEQISGSPTVYTTDQYYDPGATISDAIFRDCMPRLNSVGSYTFNRCWLQNGLYNQAGEPTISTVTLNDCTIGTPYGLGSNDSRYENNGWLGGNGGKATLARCMVMHGGSQLFLHISGPSSITDSFFWGMFAPDYVVDPHMDTLWVQDTSHTITVSRNHFEAASAGTSSIIGPGDANNMTCTDNLFNGGSANGTLVTGTGSTYTGNRFMRAPTGGLCKFDVASGNTLINTAQGSGTQSDNRWADDGTSV
jgi:hypothetical protein